MPEILFQKKVFTQTDLLTTPAMARQIRRSDQPLWDHPEYQSPFCLDLAPFKSQEGRKRDRHLGETRKRVIVWRCPYCSMRKHSHRFDDLRNHVWAMYRQHSQALHPPRATLEPLVWQEERGE